uniref:Uncharacterized protein n=1 Tax=Tanacetum cinerariifolium TaxID=118510 RepID=A0A6L2J9Q5_TANCI|nr:hypothetical protein [Tanacetum cinerariifolium]
MICPLIDWLDPKASKQRHRDCLQVAGRAGFSLGVAAWQRLGWDDLGNQGQDLSPEKSINGVVGGMRPDLMCLGHLLKKCLYIMLAKDEGYLVRKVWWFGGRSKVMSDVGEHIVDPISKHVDFMSNGGGCSNLGGGYETQGGGEGFEGPNDQLSMDRTSNDDELVRVMSRNVMKFEVEGDDYIMEVIKCFTWRFLDYMEVMIYLKNFKIDGSSLLWDEEEGEEDEGGATLFPLSLIVILEIFKGFITRS